MYNVASSVGGRKEIPPYYEIYLLNNGNLHFKISMGI